MKDLRRLLAPRSIAVIGGGAWCESIVVAAKAIGFSGSITPIHPTKATVAGLPALPSVLALDSPPDAAFVGVNRHASLDVIRDLNATDAGGAICFASGFAEAEAEAKGAGNLQADLVEAAGEMPILGPNCYGFLNALDRTGIWPDQHGLRPVERGVAILTQSSNIAINLTMQKRGVPIAMVITCGNKAQTTQAGLAAALLDDPRITAIGLHIEGFGDLREWEATSDKARKKDIPIIAIKSGRSVQARAAAVSHTASMTGADAGADAFLARLGIARVHDLPTFLEALKVAHLYGRLPGRRIASISCSGGEAALAADAAFETELVFPPLTDSQQSNLRAALGPMVALANPLDYHTYVWRDCDAMTKAWAGMADPGNDLTLIILDFPRDDLCNPSDWDIATTAAIRAQEQTGARYAVCATLPELLPEATAKRLMDAGVLPLHGLDHAMAAIDAMSRPRSEAQLPVTLPGHPSAAETVTEAEAKASLSAHGLRVPKGQHATRETAADIADIIGGKVAVKVLGLAHKTGHGGLALGLTGRDSVAKALPQLADGPLWIEEMIEGGQAELLIGVTRDPAHGFLLTLAAGGTLTEILADRTQLLVPSTRSAVSKALRTLKIAPLFDGYRGAPGVNLDPILDAVDAIQSYVIENAGTLEELEINPFLVTKDTAIAVDALIRKAPHEPD